MLERERERLNMLRCVQIEEIQITFQDTHFPLSKNLLPNSFSLFLSLLRAGWSSVQPGAEEGDQQVGGHPIWR